MKPNATRPYMPDYGLAPAADGLLDWAWAVERLTASHEYWVATADTDGKPALMPVWGGWIEDALWFSSGNRSRRVRNLERDPRCTIATDNTLEPVVVEGTAHRIDDRDAAAVFATLCTEKYSTEITVEFVLENALFRVPPSVVYGLTEAEFATTPTKWVFDQTTA
jgi:hypothetical protein